MNMNNDNIYEYKKKFDISQFKGVFRFVGGFIALIILLNIFFTAFTFTVDEREQVVVKQLNEVIKVVVDEKTEEMEETIANHERLKKIKIIEGKGLFFKIPFIQTTESFTNMLLTYDTLPREVTTKDKKKLVLDNFAQWQINNPALFISTLENQNKAHQRLDDIIYAKINEEVGKVEAHTVISDKEYSMAMLKRVSEEINEELGQYGVEVVDIRIKRTDLPPENYEKVFNRMRTERVRAAKAYRSEGKEEAQKIRSSAEKEATIIEAQAYEQAEKIKGEGEAEAVRIYAEAYNADPEFYAFWKTLQTYKKTLKDKTKIVIDADSEFAKYLFNSK